MNTDEIKQRIEGGMPDCKAFVTGSEGKYEATVVSAGFADMSTVKKHQKVYATVKTEIASGEIHALSIKALTPEEWDEHSK